MKKYLFLVLLLAKNAHSYAQHWHLLNDKPVSDTVSYASAPAPAIQVFQSDSANGTGLLIFPGGGYHNLVWDKEGMAIARAFATKGLTCFVLKYRLPDSKTQKDFTTVPLNDAQQALSWIKKHAVDYHLDTTRIGVIGFSAGGHLASTLANHHAGNLAFQILVYPVISMQDGLAHMGSRQALIGEGPSQAVKDAWSGELQVNQQTPPAYITHTGDDKTVPVENSIRYYQALLNKQIKAELHLYPEGGHGFIKKLPVAEWLEPMTLWMEKNGYIPRTTK